MQKRAVIIRTIALLVWVTAVCTIARSQESDSPAQQALAQADDLANRQDFKEALEAYERADTLANHSCAECFLRMAAMHRMLGDFPAALSDAERAASTAGSDHILGADAHYMRATLLAESSSGGNDPKLREAETEFRAALALDSKKSIAHFSLGMMLFGEGRDTEGVAEMRAYVSGPFANPRYVDRARRIIADPSRALMPTTDQFSFTTLEGQTITNDSLRGKVTLLDFWGTWCPPCRESVPMVARLHREFAGRPFQIVGISSDDDEASWRAFISENHMDWSEYIDLDRKILAIFEIDSYPTFIVLNRSGVMEFRQSGVGQDSQKELEGVINKALAESYTPALSATGAASGTAGAPASVAAPATSYSDSAVSAVLTPAVSSPSPLPLYVPLRAGLSAAASSNGIADAVQDAGALGSAAVADSTRFISPPDDVENGDADQGLYRNEFLGLSYKYPPSLKPATAEALDQANEMATQWITGHAGGDQRSAVSLPRIVFQAGQSLRDAAPLVRISVEQLAQAEPLTIESLRREAEALQQRTGVTIIAVPAQVTGVHGSGRVFRTDFQQALSTPPTWQSSVTTVIEGRYRVTLEIVARSQAELNSLAASVASLAITRQ